VPPGALGPGGRYKRSAPGGTRRPFGSRYRPGPGPPELGPPELGPPGLGPLGLGPLGLGPLGLDTAPLVTGPPFGMGPP